MPPYTQYTPFSPYENVLSNFWFCNSPFFLSSSNNLCLEQSYNKENVQDVKMN